jgi:hypothetical protein
MNKKKAKLCIDALHLLREECIICDEDFDNAIQTVGQFYRIFVSSDEYAVDRYAVLEPEFDPDCVAPL